MANRTKTGLAQTHKALPGLIDCRVCRCWVVLPKRQPYQTGMHSTLSLQEQHLLTSAKSLLQPYNLSPWKKNTDEQWLQTLSPCLRVRAHSSLTSVPVLPALSIKRLSQTNSMSWNTAYLETFVHLAPSNNTKYLQWHAMVFTSFRKYHSEQRKGMVHNQVPPLYRSHC